MTLRSEVSDLTLTLTQSQAAPVLLKPQNVTAQEGDDVILSIALAADSGEPTSIIWRRGDEELVGERFSSSTQRGAVNLTVRNATVEDAGRYSLTTQNEAGQAHSDLLLEVRTQPGDVPVFLRRLNDLAVKVGTRTRFLVEVRSPTQVKVSWEQEGNPVLEGERFHLLHEGSFFCVDVAPVTLEDAGIWICRAHNSNGVSKCFCHLNVLVPKAYKAPQFVEELVALLTQQGTVSLECKVVGVPTPTLKWFKDNQEIKAGDVFALSANPQDATSLGTYTCEATNCMGKAYSTSRVHVMGKEGSVQPADSIVPRGPPPVFCKELRNEKTKIGGKLTLECKVTVPPWPKSITWFNKGGVVEGGEGSRYHLGADGLGSYSVEVDQIEAIDDGEWKCVATSDNGVKGISSCTVSVSYPKNYKKPKFLESLKAILTEEGLVSFECKVVGYPTPQLRWFKDGQELKPGDVYQLTGTNSLGSYCCIAKNCMGETSSTAELTVEDIQSQLNEEERLQLFSTNQPPRFLQGLKSMEAKITDPLRFTVQVSVSPQPIVAWYRDDEEVQESEKYKKEQETKGICHLVIKRLELVDQAEWRCVATNDYGQSVTSCFLKLAVPRHYKKPRFLENLRAVLSEEGAVNLECKVIGVPQPTLKWYKDGRELKPGDIHRIISGQDGTCCLGTYTCEASNCMGTVSSSASLLGFEDRGQVKQPEPLRPLPPPAAHLVRQTSLSTIQEERTSQMHDTTLDERAEVSFSFDGKEVSVSLYETPDLTEEEALQVVEMYAEELSEHISEHNVVELPPMRFVKETSTSGHLLMEAVVIDVSPEYYASAEDRTEADLDEFSITEDNNGFMSPMVITPEEMPFEKFSADFLERTIQPVSSTQQSVPIKPPRKRVADASESSYHSFKEAKVSPEEDSSEQFVDALSSHRDKSQKESFASVKSSSGDKQKAVIDVEPIALKSSDTNTKELSVSLRENNGKLSETKKVRKKSRSRSKSSEKQPGDIISDNSTVLKDPNLEKKSQKRPLKKRKSTDSEKEDDSLREFEKRKTLKSGFEQEDLSRQAQVKGAVKKNKSSESEKEDDSLQEFESRKSLQKSEKVSEINKTKGYLIKPASDSSGREDDSLIEYEKRKISSDVSSDKGIIKSERQKIPFSKSISTDSSEKDDVFAIKSETSEQINLRKKRKKSVKKSGSIEKKDQSQKSEIEVPPSSEAESVDREPLKGKKVVSTSDLDRMRSTSDLDSIGDKSRAQEEEEHSADFDTAEDSAYDKSEMSVLESLTHSVQEIQKGLMAVEEKIISESSEEPLSAKSSLSIIESLVQPIHEIQQGLAKVEKIAEESKAGQYSPSSILETLKEPIQELERNLAVIEQQNVPDGKELTLFKRTSQSVLETVSQPLHELHRELAFIQQQAVIETGEETYSEILQSFKPSLLIVQGGVEHTEGEFSSKLDDLTEKTTTPQPTYAQSVVELQTEIHNTDQNLLQNNTVQSESFVPITVQDIEESLVESIISQQSLHTVKDSKLHNELQMYSLSLENCLTSLKEKAYHTTDNEIKDILTLTSNLIAPLEQFRTVIERCLLTVIEDDRSIDPQLRAANLALNTALRHSIHAFGSSVNLLEIVANSNSNKEIRGLGIQMLYKLSFPLEELTTTIKLVENLSEHTSVELLTTPVEHLMNASSIIKPELAKTGFAENVSEDGVIIIRELNDTVGSLSNSLRSVTKSLKTFSSLSSLSSLCKPLADLQKTLHKTENKIKMPEKCNKLNSSELYNLAQDLCKPLQAIRTELSLAQHEIELDQYGHLSLMTDPLQEVNPESASAIVLQSLDQVHKSVLTCTEFVLSKSLNESSYLRFVLFALNELILPFNQLNSSIIKTEELFSKDISKLPEPTTGIQAVKSSASDLLAELSELQRHSARCLSIPETAVIEVLCRMAEPLTRVEDGLNKIIEDIHKKDKDSLNINMLKTLAEPFKYLQKSLINISDKLDSQMISHEIFLELKQPIQELQRSILIIQDQVSFEYGDEPATMESNIVTLQSLVQPLNALKKQFSEIDGLLTDKTQSSSYSKENKNLHSIISVNHELQLKISSIMIQENYLNKHSLDSLDMFPIFQDLSGLLKDFENALKRVDLICQNESKPDSLFHIKLSESVNSFRSDVINFQNRIVLASNKAIKDVKHPVHYLKKGTETFLSKLSSNADILMNCKLDESSLASGYFVFCQNCSTTFVDLLEYLSHMESTWEGELSFKEDINRDITDISSASFSDTIKDVNTIVDDITETRVSLESASIPLIHSTALLQVTQELQIFCNSLKTAEESLLENTLRKVNSSISNKEEDKLALVSAFNAMKVQLEKIETYLTDNHDALESISQLKYTLEVVKEHLMFGEEVSEVYILQNLSGPLKTFKDTISKDSPVTISEMKESESVSLYLERFEKSASDLELGLMKLEHALLNSTGDFSSLKNVDIDVLAHPIEELVQYIHNIEEQQNSLHVSESVADQSSLTMLKTLAVPIKEIQEGVLQIQEQIIFESSGNGIPGKSCAGILYEIAKPIRELRSGVALIQEQVVMEADVDQLSEETKASSLKTLAVPVEELKKVLSSIIEQQTLLMEPDLQSLSENISILKTIAVPAKELQNKLAAIEVNQIMEGNVESFSAKENLLMLAKPIHILQESIALVENQLALETLGDDLSARTNISLLKIVAKPLQEVAKHIAIITEQQFVEDVNSEDNTLSDLSTLANVTDISMVSAVLNINENVVLEQGVSFRTDFPDFNIAEAVRGNQLNIAVIEQQQDLINVENTPESNLKIRLENVDHGNLASVSEKEICSPLVAIQQTVSQVETMSINEPKTLQLAEFQDVSCNFAVQAEIQEVLIPAGNFAVEEPQFESGIKQDSSLKMAVQVETQEALFQGKSITSDDNVQVKSVEEEFEPAFVAQGELQQSLADVESLETEEETLKSISVEESSFRIEPQVNIQQVLSDAESFILTDKTSHVAEVKNYIQSGFQSEIQQILSTEENLKTFQKSSDLASVVETTPIVALEGQIQQAMSNVGDLKSEENVYNQANIQETLLEGAVQAECQQILSNVESLTSDSGIARHSQAVTMEEGFWKLPVQSQILEFISVAEVIQDVKEELKAKIDSEPFYGEAVQQEIQELLTAAESIQSIKEALQVVCVEEPALHTATQSKAQEILSTHEGVQNLKEILDGKHVEDLKKCEGLNVELQQIISTAQSLDNLRQAISLNNDQTESHQVLPTTDSLSGFENNSKAGILQEPLFQPNETVTKIVPYCADLKQMTEDEVLSDTNSLITNQTFNEEAIPRFAEETEVQELISLTSNIKTTTEALKAKISTEPSLKCIAQKEFQQIFNIAEEIQSVNEALQRASVEKQTVNVATKIEIQQILTACESLKTIEETIKVNSGKGLDIKSAIQFELQQVLCSADTVQSVKKALASQTYVESLNEKVVVHSQVCALQNRELSQENIVKEQVDVQNILELKHDISVQENIVDENVTSITEEKLKKSLEYTEVQEMVSSDTGSIIRTELASEKGKCSDVPLTDTKEEAAFISQQIDITSKEVCKNTTEPHLVIEEVLTSTDKKHPVQTLLSSDKDNTLTSIPLIGEECFTERSKVLEVQETLVGDISSKSPENTLVKVERSEVISTDKSSISQKPEINTSKEDKSFIPETVKDIRPGIEKPVSSAKNKEPEHKLSSADEVGTSTTIPLLAEEALTKISTVLEIKETVSDISSKNTEKDSRKVEHSDLASMDINNKSKLIIQKGDISTSTEGQNIIPGIVHDTKPGIEEAVSSGQRKELGSILLSTDEVCTTTSVPLFPEKNISEISEVLEIQDTVISGTSSIRTEKDLKKSKLADVDKVGESKFTSQTEDFTTSKENSNIISKNETKPQLIDKDACSLKDSTKLEKLQSPSDNDRTHNKDLADRELSTEIAKTTKVQDTTSSDTSSESTEKSLKKDKRSDMAILDKKHDDNNEDITSKDGEILIKCVKESQLGTQESATSKDSKTLVHSLSTSEKDISSFTSSKVQIETKAVCDDSLSLIAETKAVTNLKNQLHTDVQETKALDFENKTEQELSDFTDVPSSKSIIHSQKQDLDGIEKSKCLEEDLQEKVVTLSDSIKHAIQIETQQTFESDETTALHRGILPEEDHSQEVYVGKPPLGIAYHDDVQEVLSAVDYLDVATETLKSLTVQESPLTVTLESEIQQFLLTTENLITFKESLQAKVVDEPFVLASVNTEFQQILNAVESLKAVKETMQAKCALEPNLPVAQNALPQILLTTQQLEHICEAIEAKMSQVQITQIAAQTEMQELLGSIQHLEKGEIKEVTSMVTSTPNLKIAAQVELQQSLFSTKEVQHVTDTAKASCTHAPCIQICAKKSGVASFNPDSKITTKEEKTVVEKVVLDEIVKEISDIAEPKNVNESTTSTQINILEKIIKEEDKTDDMIEKVKDIYKVKMTEESKPKKSEIETTNQLDTSDKTMIITSKESGIEKIKSQNQATVPKVGEKDDIKEISQTSGKYQENAKEKTVYDDKLTEYIAESEQNIKVIDKVPIESITQVVSDKDISHESKDNIKYEEKDKGFESEFNSVGLNNTTEIKAERSLIEVNRSKLNEETKTIQDISTAKIQEVKSKDIYENKKTNDDIKNKCSDDIKRSESSQSQPPKEFHTTQKAPLEEFDKKDSKVEQVVTLVPLTQTVDATMDLEKENEIERNYEKEKIKVGEKNKETKNVSKKKKRQQDLQDCSKSKEEIVMENNMKENEVKEPEISKLIEDRNVPTASGTEKEESKIIEEDRTYQDSKVKIKTHKSKLSDECILDTSNQKETLEIESVIKDTVKDDETVKISQKLDKIKHTMSEKEHETKLKDESLVIDTAENTIKEESDIEHKDVNVKLKNEEVNVFKDTEESVKIKKIDETKIIDVDVSRTSIHNREEITKTESSKELKSINTDLQKTSKQVDKNVEHGEKTKYDIEKGVEEQDELKKVESETQGSLTPTVIHSDKHIEKESVTQGDSEKVTPIKIEELNKDSTQPTVEVDIEQKYSEKPKYEVKAMPDKKNSGGSTELTKIKDNTDKVEDIKKRKSVKDKKKSKDTVSMLKDEGKPDNKGSNVCDTLEVKTPKQPEVSEITTKCEISEDIKDKGKDIHGKENNDRKVETSKETQKRKESIKQKSEVIETDDKIKSLDKIESEKISVSEKISENVNVEQSFDTNKYIDMHVSGKPKGISTIEGEVSDIKDECKEEYSSLKNIKGSVELHQKTKAPEKTVIPDKVKHMKGGKSIKTNEEINQDTNSKLSGEILFSDLKRDDIDPTKNKYNNVEDQNITFRKSKISEPSPKGEEKEKQSSDKIQTKQRLFVDESSTSDYSSESYSESFKIKKSQSYDTRQWIYESESKRDEPEGSQLTITKKLTEKKYETPSAISQEKSSYQRQRRQTASKPVFCGRLIDRTAAQGSKLKVTCSLTGSPEPTVQWYKDGHLISAVQDPRLRMRLSNGLASLEITEAILGDSGKYTCVARNASGETSTTSTIKIFSYIESAPEAPVFTQAVKDQYKSSSDELVIECKVKGHPLPSVTWLKDSQPLRIASRYQQSVLTDGTCRLVIHGPEPSDSGLYKCVAENPVWSEQTSGFVMFEGREKHLAASRSLTDTRVPRFTNILSDHVVREGGTVALQVAIKGTPKAEVTWYRNSVPLPKKSSRFRYLEDGGVYSLVMSDASITEAGTYTCRASNLHGYRDTNVNVQIVGGARGKPAMFVSRPDTSMNIAVGEDITISFRVTGDPKPRVTWMKGMKDITNNIRTLKETVNDYVRLSLKHATVMDSGTYFITAKNIYGTDHAFVTVRVRQRARSLTPTRSIWSGPDTSTLLRDIHESTKALVNDVPGPVASEATVSDSGKNWVSLTWGKPENRGAAPVLAYRVEAWLLGSEGGAHWTELGVTPINSFDAFFLKPGGEYKFRISARNRYGWGESVTSTDPVTIGSASNYPPDILRDLPGPLKALQGDNITLECEVGGDPPPYVQWLRDGQDVGTIAALRGRVFVSDSQLTHRLIVKQLTEDDSGRYVCEAVNKLGRASTYARLLVVSDPRLLEADRKLKEDLVENQESAPQVTMRLRDRRVQTTYPVRLSCQVVGNPTPTVSWAHQGNPISSDDRHQLVAEADHFYTLEICRTVLEDGGQYTVTAQNCLGAVSCHCQLTVDKGIRAYVAPDYTSELEPTVTVREGSDLHLFAQVEAYPTVGIAWHRDGVRLRPSRRLVMTVDCEGRVQLSLAGITAREAGLYCCTATNAVGRAQTSCQVTVTSGTAVTANLPTILAPTVPYSKEPRFVTKPRSSEAVEGETVVITCEVVGDPQPDVMWLRDWLKPGYYRDAPQFRQVAGGCQYSLEIPQVKLDFTGTYCVIASNPHGEAKAIISLQIYAKGQGKESSMVSGQVKHGKVETLPEIKRELKDLRCCDGDSATLECLVLATPPPAVRWEKDGKLLPLGEDIEAAVDGEVARLTIKKVYPEDEGQYSCVAYNELGRAVTTACLVVDVPEEKETLLSQQLSRPPGLLSARSTPHSTPRNTPSPARSVSPLPSRYREFSSPSYSRPKRLKMSSPKFYTVPHNRIAEEGETVRFQCAVAGHPTPWASWDKDGHIVTPSARLSVTERDDLRTLELREVTVEDAGLYRVTLENEMGSVEATARLDVIGRQGSRTRSVRAWSAMRASPTFGRRLVGSAARVGGTFTLTCDVHASPSPITSWYRNGEMLVMSDRVVPSWDGRRARLELRGLQQEDAGVYTCVAENAVGTTQCSAELRVLQTTDPSDADLQPPVFLQGLLPELTVVEGQPVELQTRLQGSTPMEVVWVKDGVEVPDCEDFRHVDYGDGRYGLRIADLFLADGGIYNCEAFNDHGDAITSGHLIVTDPAGTKSARSQEPEICFTKTPSPVIARLRGPATFCARLQGNSLSLSHTSFTWTVGGRTVSSTDHRCQVTTEGDCSVLHISEVCAGDAGPVTCTARVCSPGVPPTTVSCDTHLGLDCAPGSPAILLRGPSDTTVMRGDRVLLKATYRGSPEPHVRWLKAGRELRTEGRVQIVSCDGVSCLTVSAITADDSGKYVVSVENIHGADCHFASVAVEGPPEPPAARPSVSRGSGCATVAWSSPAYDGGCVLTGYRVEMRTTDSQDWSVVADRCHSLSHVVRGLTPGQSYVFRVRAENIHGASDSSAESFPFTLDSPDQREEELEAEQEGEEGTLMQVSLEPGEQFLQRYSVHEELGKGRYGVVHKVTDLRTQHTMAAKFVRCIKKQDREKVQEEIDIMNCLRHPKLLQLVAAFENPKDIVMIMEYISGGELFERVVADDFTLTERDCILFLRQICEGVSYMHQSHVVHLDLKPENIMCHTRTSHRIKIIDFGLAQKLESGTPVRVLFGTPEFIPPEIINYEPIGVESDMWSVGVICYVLLSGLSPFMGDNDAETFANITRADYDFDDEAFDAISQDAKDFISALLIKRKEKRLTADECLQHKWLTQCDMAMSCVKLSTDKLKKFIIRRKWQKTGNAIRALGRMATLSAASRRNSSGSTPPSPRPSLATSRLSSLGEEESDVNKTNRARMCSERSDSGISDCSSINTCAARPLLGKKYSICEEPECDPSSYSRPGVNTNRSCDGVNGKLTSGVSVTAKIRSTSSLRPFAEPPAKAPSPTLQKDAKLFSKNENFQKAFAFWKQ